MNHLIGKLHGAALGGMRIALWTAVLSFGAHAGDQWTFTAINFPGAILTEAEGISPAGDIAGLYVDASAIPHTHGFVLRHGMFISIDYPGAEYTDVRSISPGGEIVGNYSMPGENPGFVFAAGGGPLNMHGFVMKRDGTFLPLAYPGHPNMIAQRILPDGSVLGCYHDHDYGYWMRGFLWNSGLYTGLDGTLDRLNVPSSMNNGATPGLNQIAGIFMDMDLNKVRAFVIQSGTLVPFDYPGASITRAWDINPSGAVVGDYRDATGAHGFLSAGGVFTSLQFPGASVTQARGINPGGVAVGWYRDAKGTHGFMSIPVPVPND